MMAKNKSYFKITALGLLLLLGLFVMVKSWALFSNPNKTVPALNKGNNYDAKKEITLALNNLKEKNHRAEILTGVNTSEKVVALAFQGLSDAKTNRQVLDLITQHNIKVNFFIPGMLAAEDTSFVKQVYRQGHHIGSNTLSQRKNMQDYSQEELVKDFAQANSILRTITKRKPQSLTCNSTIYTEDLLEAAYAAGNKKLVQPTKFLNYQSLSDYKQVLNYLAKLQRGSIIAIKMDGVLDETEADQPIQPARPDQKPRPIKENSPVELRPTERLVNLLEWLLQGLEESGYRVVLIEDLASFGDNKQPLMLAGQPLTYPIPPISSKPLKSGSTFKKFTQQELDMLRQANGGRKAKQYNTIYTTEKALAYTFYGIQNQEVLAGVLTNLDKLKAKGTFYVNKKDIQDHPQTIKKIAAKGHELAISLVEANDKDYYSTLESILAMQKSVHELTMQKPALVRYPYDLTLQDEILEAISSANCKVVWQDLNIASSRVGVNGKLDAVMENVFDAGNITARRGYIIYFRMDYYQDLQVIPDALIRIARDRIDTVAYQDEIENNDSHYQLKPVGNIINGGQTYNYPLREIDILPEVRNLIAPGHLAAYDESEKFNLIRTRYIGNPDVSKPNTLPGFTNDELAVIDKTGVFTTDKVLFLTFDDWSSDKSINQLLYVLNKHQVPGNFYIRTNYMQNNPNILRAIAEAGHDVGSHSDDHLPFAINATSRDEDDTTSIYHSLNEEEILVRRDDLLVSYNKLQQVIGDVSVDQRPALTTVFRPPTLAMSKIGMETIFDMGFSHIVSGDFSTHDYEDTDPTILVDKIIKGMVLGDGSTREIQNGSILVMHMSDFKTNPTQQPNVTAKAMDMVIPLLKAEGYSFARLSDYLTTTGGEYFE